MRFCSWMLAGTIAVTAACDSPTGVVLVITAGQGLADANLEAPIELYLYDDTQLAEPVGLTRFRRIEPTALGGDILPIDTDDSDLENDGYRVFIPLEPGQSLRGVLVAGTATQNMGQPQVYEGSALFDVTAPASGVGEWPVVLRRPSRQLETDIVLTGAISTMRADGSICVGVMQDGAVQKLIIPGDDREALDLDCDGIAVAPACSADETQHDPLLLDDVLLPENAVDDDGDTYLTCTCTVRDACDCDDSNEAIHPGANTLTCEPVIDAQDLDCDPVSDNPVAVLPVPCATFDPDQAAFRFGLLDCKGTCVAGNSAQQAIGNPADSLIGDCNHELGTCTLAAMFNGITGSLPRDEYGLDELVDGERIGGTLPDFAAPCEVRVWNTPNGGAPATLSAGEAGPLAQQWNLETCAAIVRLEPADSINEITLAFSVTQFDQHWVTLWQFKRTKVTTWLIAPPL